MAATKLTESENNRITLCHYLETLIKDYKESHDREHKLLAEASRASREALDVRLETMNQFRAQILSERGMMVSKERCDVVHDSVEKRVNAVEAEVANLGGRMAAYAIALGVGLAIMQIILRFVVK